MDIFDKFLKEVSYKFPKGYPDVNDSKDMEMLKSLMEEYISEKQVLKEGSEVYDNTIKRALDVDEIPRSKNKYQWNGSGGSSFSIQVKQDDKEVWDKLYNVAPPKKGETEGETKGVGNGEIALYWLYNYSNSGVEVNEGREGDDPDLFFNGVGVEVKAYSKHTGKIGLGRFGADRENLALLGVIFGINTLSKTLGGDVGPAVNPTNFLGKSLPAIFKTVFDLEEVDLESLAGKYSIFKTLKDNIDYINKELDNPDTVEDASKAIALKLISSKLSRKPGNGGYLANVLKNGDIKFFAIDLDKVKDSDALLSDFNVKQSAIYVNFSKLFG
jgi:hypothetical protein